MLGTYPNISGADMRCDFCYGTGMIGGQVPCKECGGQGIVSCCEGSESIPEIQRRKAAIVKMVEIAQKGNHPWAWSPGPKPDIKQHGTNRRAAKKA